MLLLRAAILILFAAFAYLVMRSFAPFAGVLAVALVGGGLIAFLMVFLRNRGRR